MLEFLTIYYRDRFGIFKGTNDSTHHASGGGGNSETACLLSPFAVFLGERTGRIEFAQRMVGIKTLHEELSTLHKVLNSKDIVSELRQTDPNASDDTSRTELPVTTNSNSDHNTSARTSCQCSVALSCAIDYLVRRVVSDPDPNWFPQDYRPIPCGAVAPAKPLTAVKTMNAKKHAAICFSSIEAAHGASLSYMDVSTMLAPLHHTILCTSFVIAVGQLSPLLLPFENHKVPNFQLC